MAPRLILSIGKADIKEAFNPLRFRTSVRVRLPLTFRFAREPEFVSVTKDQFDNPANKIRARELLSTIQGHVQHLEGFAGWRAALNDDNVEELRSSKDRRFLWKLMIIEAVLAERSEKYFAGQETIADAFAAAIGMDLRRGPFHAVFTKNLLDGYLDPISLELAMTLTYEEIMRAERTATNAEVFQAYVMAFFTLLAIWETLPFAGAMLLEGGIGGGFTLANFSFAATVGFFAYLRRVSEITADGEITEEEADSLLLPLVCMLVLPLFNLLPNKAQLAVAIPLTVMDLLDKLEQAAEGLIVLTEYLGLIDELEEAGFDGFVIDDESTIVVPGF